MRRRLRSACKWSGTVLTVLLLVVWVGSRWWRFGGLVNSRVEAGVSSGRLHVYWVEPWSLIDPIRKWFPNRLRGDEPFDWWFDASRSTRSYGQTETEIWIPIWSLMLLAAVPTVCICWRDRRRAPGSCIKCGYDLRGADHKVCPECGSGVLAVDK